MQGKNRVLGLIYFIWLLLVFGCAGNQATENNAESIEKDSTLKPVETDIIVKTESTTGSENTQQSVKGNPTLKPDEPGNSAKTISEPGITIKVFKNDLPLTGYGYDILLDGKIYVHQPNIPAVPGNNGFSTEEAARKTAELVTYKIKNKIMPPSVDVKELDSLGVLK